jgi:hypothetical protein
MGPLSQLSPFDTKTVWYITSRAEIILNPSIFQTKEQVGLCSEGQVFSKKPWNNCLH